MKGKCQLFESVFFMQSSVRNHSFHHQLHNLYMIPQSVFNPSLPVRKRSIKTTLNGLKSNPKPPGSTAEQVLMRKKQQSRHQSERNLHRCAPGFVFQAGPWWSSTWTNLMSSYEVKLWEYATQTCCDGSLRRFLFFLKCWCSTWRFPLHSVGWPAGEIWCSS